MRTQQRLFARFSQQVAAGELTWIGLRPERKAPMLSVRQCRAIKDQGLEGDHRCLKTPGSARQVTLISQQWIEQTALFSGHASISPSILRRNLVVTGINLHLLRYQQFRIGEVVFEANALCHPCSRMEQALGKGGVAAMMGHGGLCCKILNNGEIAVGDAVSIIAAQQDLF